MWLQQKSRVPLKYKLHIFISERYNGPVIHYYIVQECSRCLTGYVDIFLIELKSTHSEASQYHEGAGCRHNECDLPSKQEANQTGKDEAQSCFHSYGQALCCEPIQRTDIFSYHVSQDAGCPQLAVIPSHTLVQNCPKQLYSQGVGQVFTPDREA